MLLHDLSKFNSKIKIEINIHFLHITSNSFCWIFMTPRNEYRMSSITSHFINIEKNNKNMKNNICKFPNILSDFMNRYNNLDDDTKTLCDFAQNLQKVNSMLESSISRLKREYNQLQTQLRECNRRLLRAQETATRVSECTTSPENICSICMTNPRECAYVNCGHVCACIECCERMGNKCPICRQNGNFIKLISV